MEKAKLLFLVDQDQITLLYDNSFYAFNFDNYEIVNGVICNQTQVVGVISNYLYQNKLTKFAGTVVFTENLLHKKIISQTNLQMNLIDSIYVKTALGQDNYYVATLELGVLLQYQILFWLVGTYIESFTAGRV